MGAASRNTSFIFAARQRTLRCAREREWPTSKLMHVLERRSGADAAERAAASLISQTLDDWRLEEGTEMIPFGMALRTIEDQM